MGNKVSVNSSSPYRVSINSQQRTTVKTVGVAPATNINLNDIKDVDSSDADNNETLVYDETLNKFVVKTLPVVDGGTF